MAEAQKQAASFDPDEASGLLDNARVTITGVKVDTFKATSGVDYVNVNVTLKGSDAQEITEKYMLGGVDQWAPDANKTGAIPVGEGTGKIWNKSDVFKFMKSLRDAGFPKARLGADLSVLVGLDVQVSRVTQEGATYTDKNGKERARTTLLVTKIHTPVEQLSTGAYATGKKPQTKTTAATKTAAAAATAAAAGANVADDSNDAYVSELLLEILGENAGTIAKDKIAQPAFMKITKAKKSPIRAAVQARLQDDAFLASLVEGGVITYDGTTIAVA